MPALNQILLHFFALWRIVTERMEVFMVKHWSSIERAPVNHQPRKWIKYLVGGMLAHFPITRYLPRPDYRRDYGQRRRPYYVAEERYRME